MANNNSIATRHAYINDWDQSVTCRVYSVKVKMGRGGGGGVIPQKQGANALCYNAGFGQTLLHQRLSHRPLLTKQCSFKLACLVLVLHHEDDVTHDNLHRRLNNHLTDCIAHQAWYIHDIPLSTFVQPLQDTQTFNITPNVSKVPSFTMTYEPCIQPGDAMVSRKAITSTLHESIVHLTRVWKFVNEFRKSIYL